MPEANVFEKTKLLLKTKVSRGKARNSHATWTFKNDATGESKTVQVEIGKSGTDVRCEFVTAEVPDGKESYLLTCELEADGRKFKPATPYRVWPHFFDLKALGKDGKPFPRFAFQVKQAGAPAVENGKGPQTGEDGTLRVDLKVTGALTVEAVSPYLIEKWTAGKDKGRNLEATVSRKPYVGAIYFPSDKEVKQYVNLDAREGANEGHRVKVTVGPKEDKGKDVTERAGVEGDVLYVQVVFSDKNSKRNDPKPAVFVDGSEADFEADKRTVKTKVKLGPGGNPAVFEVELGVAGGDVCEIKTGVTEACADDKIKITNWRKLAMEIIQPKADELSSYTVFKGDKSEGLADDQVQAIAKTLGKDKVFVELEVSKASAYASGDLAGRAPYVVFDGAYFQRDAGKKMIALAPQHYADLQAAKGSNPQDKRSLVTVWADYYQSEDAIEIAEKLESASLEKNIPSPSGVFKFDPQKADGTLGITQFYWQAVEYRKDDGSWAAVTHAEDPGGAKMDPQVIPLDWNELQHYLEFVHYRKIKIKLPKRPGKEATDPGFFLNVNGKQVKIGVYLMLSGAKFQVNAAGWHGFIWMSTFGGRFKTGGLVTTLLHELGHNLGQAYADKSVDATFGRSAANEIPGLPFPPGVPEGVVYGGHNHLGTHCATGVSRSNREKDSFQDPAVSSQATCIMFGATDMSEANGKEYCEQCRTFIRATESDNITKAWES